VSKKAKNSSNKLNWKNDKLTAIGRNFQFSDGRLTKEDILQISNQTLFTKLKSGGYIKEVENGSGDSFKTTDKFRKEYKLNVDSKESWKGSGGSTHTQGMAKMAKLVPREVITAGNFKTGETLKNEFDSLKNRQAFKQEANKMREDKRQEIIQREQLYKSQLDSAVSDKQKLYYEGKYKVDSQKLQKELKVLNSKNAFSVPDTKITLTRDQAEEMLDNLRNSFDQYHQRNHEMIQEAVHKLEQTIEQTQGQSIEISIEVCTENYSFEDKCSHNNYEQATNSPTLYLPSK